MLGQCLEAITTQNGLVLSLFIAGLVGGLTHCSGMCGPFVLAQTGALGNESGGFWRKMRAGMLLPYHLGRMTTYIMLAVLLSTVLNAAFLYGPAKALLSSLLLMAAGSLFLMSVFPALQDMFPWLVKIRLPVPRGLIEKLARPFTQKISIFHRYILGGLMGFLPCGLLVAALMAAGTAAGPYNAALAMASFSVGTMFPLWIIGGVGRTIAARWPGVMAPLARAMMMVSGLVLFVMAGSMIL